MGFACLDFNSNSSNREEGRKMGVMGQADRRKVKESHHSGNFGPSYFKF